eukprot:6205129-Pleurochrysis_carterae.AAC.1
MTEPTSGQAGAMFHQPTIPPEPGRGFEEQTDGDRLDLPRLGASPRDRGIASGPAAYPTVDSQN